MNTREEGIWDGALVRVMEMSGTDSGHSDTAG